MIYGRTLGPIELVVDGQPADDKLMWRKNAALLVYLASSPKRTRSKDHLTGLLWPDKPEPTARHSLREAIRVIRRAVGEGGIDTDHDQVRLHADVVRLDTEEFRECEEREDLAGATALVHGPFLEGFTVPDASPFEDWLTAERLNWQHRSVVALVAHAEALTRHGHVRAAGDAALQALRLDPTSDAALRSAMSALVLSGDRAGALRQYDQFVNDIAETGREPGEEIQELAARVRAEREWRLPADVPARNTEGAELRRAPLVGRHDELRQLVDTFDYCRNTGRSGACVIESEAGLGKTRLLEELVGRARLGGASTSAVRAVHADQDAPWNALLGLARGGMLDAPGLVTAAPEAIAAFATRIPEWADRFGMPKVKDQHVGTAFTELLRAIANEQPIVLVLDDAHWMDRQSLRALVGAVRDLATAPLLLCFGIRPQPDQDELNDLRSRLGRDLAGVAVTLHPLGTDALASLVQWALPAYDEREVKRLVKRLSIDSAGIPLLALEVLHAVALGMDSGAIIGAWPQSGITLDETLPGDLPDAIVAAIRVGFRRLSKNAQSVLGAVSVLGDRVDRPTLAAVLPLEEDPLLTALDELEWQRWLHAEPRGYSFVARIVREVVARDMLTDGQRQRIQAAAAR